MTIEIFAISLLTVITIILSYTIIKLRASIDALKAVVELTLSKYILVVRSLGVAEGNVQGIASQEAKQEKIDEGILKQKGTQEITGVVKGILKPALPK